MRYGQTSGIARLPDRRGFTLIEVLLVLALMMILASLFIAKASDFFHAQEKTMNDIFWESVQAARLLAVEGDQTVEMRFDEKKRVLRWGAGETAASTAWPGKNVEFLPVDKRDTTLIGGQLIERGGMAVVHFFADGTVESFKVQLTGNDGRPSQLEIDQWTCAPITRKKP